MIILTVFLDIETSAFEANLGRVIAIGLLKGNDAVVKPAWKSEKEKQLLEWMNSELGDETIVTWYGSEFDIPFLLSREAILEIDPTPLIEAPKLDLHKKCEKNFSFSSNSLTNVAKSLDIEPEIEISGADMPSLFKLARKGNEEAKSAILNHCEDDIRTLEKVYDRTKKYLR